MSLIKALSRDLDLFANSFWNFFKKNGWGWRSKWKGGWSWWTYWFKNSNKVGWRWLTMLEISKKNAETRKKRDIAWQARESMRYNDINRYKF